MVIFPSVHELNGGSAAMKPDGEALREKEGSGRKNGGAATATQWRGEKCLAKPTKSPVVQQPPHLEHIRSWKILQGIREEVGRERKSGEREEAGADSLHCYSICVLRPRRRASPVSPPPPLTSHTLPHLLRRPAEGLSGL